MRHFVLIHRPTGELADDDLRQFLSPTTETLGTVVHARTWSAVAFGEGDGAHVCEHLVGGGGAGVAALDNRAELMLPEAGAVSDVALALRRLADQPTQRVASILGAFGLVLVGQDGRQVVLARDGLGIAPLYYRFVGDLLAVSSSARALGAGTAFDHEFIAEFLVNGTNPESRTIHENVRAVTPGSIACRVGNALRIESFWNPLQFTSDITVDHETAAQEFRSHFATGVRSCLDAEPACWAELSGGIDSSSVVSMAAVLARKGEAPFALAGTVSLVDDLGWGDERKYSDSVAQQHGVRNVQVQVGWPLRDDGEPPPHTDSPIANYAFYGGVREMHRTLKRVGCRRVLSGLGSDHYLTANLIFVADWLSRGRFVRSARALLDAAMITRTSLWRKFYEFAALPMSPSAFRRRSADAARLVPAWARSRFATQYDLRSRTRAVRRYDAAWGHKAPQATAYDLASLLGQLHPSSVFANPGVRYPFLYRPLVEYALRLPLTVRGMPHRDKLILRQALGADLPNVVSRRTGKGHVGARGIWGLTHESTRIAQLLTEPILTELGCISTRRLRRQVERARSGSKINLHMLTTTLSLELWLRVYTGRWPEPEVSTHHPTGASVAS